MAIPTELVGSLPRPMKLQEAYQAYDDGQIDFAALQAEQDKAAEDSIRRLDGRSSILGGHLDFGQPGRGWDFVSPGHGDVDFESMIRALNRIGYEGPLSIEWEDSGMDRDWGAPDALAFVRRTDFAPSSVAFDAAFSKEG